MIHAEIDWATDGQIQCLDPNDKRAFMLRIIDGLNAIFSRYPHQNGLDLTKRFELVFVEDADKELFGAMMGDSDGYHHFAPIDDASAELAEATNISQRAALFLLHQETGTHSDTVSRRHFENIKTKIIRKQKEIKAFKRSK